MTISGHLKWAQDFLNFLRFSQFKDPAWFSALLPHYSHSHGAILRKHRKVIVHLNHLGSHLHPLFLRHALLCGPVGIKTQPLRYWKYKMCILDFKLYHLKMFLKFAVFQWESIQLILCVGAGGQVTALSPAETSGFLGNEAVKINHEPMHSHLLSVLLGVLFSQLDHL